MNTTYNAFNSSVAYTYFLVYSYLYLCYISRISINSNKYQQCLVPLRSGILDSASGHVFKRSKKIQIMW